MLVLPLRGPILAVILVATFEILCGLQAAGLVTNGTDEGPSGSTELPIIVGQDVKSNETMVDGKNGTIAPPLSEVTTTLSAVDDTASSQPENLTVTSEPPPHNGTSEVITDTVEGGPAGVPILKCCPDGQYAIFQETDGSVQCLPLSTVNATSEPSNDSWLGRLMEFDSDGLMRALQVPPDFLASYSVPTCRKNRTLVHSESESIALLPEGLLALLRSGGYVRRGQFCLDLFETTSSPATSNATSDIDTDGLVQGAVVCTESVWIPPPVQTRGEPNEAVVYPKCCEAQQVLNSDFTCTNVSWLPSKIPITDFFDGHHLNDTSDEEARLRVDVVVDSLSKLQSSCSRLEPVIGSDTTTGDIKFHLLNTGHLYFPEWSSVVGPTQFCLDQVVPGTNSTNAGDDQGQPIAFVCRDGAANQLPGEINQSPAEQWQHLCGDSSSDFCVVKCCPTGERLLIDQQLGSMECEQLPKGETDWTPIFYDARDKKKQVKLADTAFRSVSLPPVCDVLGPMMTLMPEVNSSDSVRLLDNGRVFIDKYNLAIAAPSYCMDHGRLRIDGASSTASQKLTNVTLTCFPSAKKAEWYYMVYSGCLIVSAVFLALTFIVSLILPDAIWLVNWTLLNYVGSLFAGSLCLIVLFFAHDFIQGGWCTALAMVQVFTYLSSFTWLNVMSFDIWHANFFWYTRRNLPATKSKLVWKYLRRCLYAFGIPSLIVAAIAVLEFYPGIPDSFATRPIDPSMRCWFKNNAAMWLFFLGPIALLVLANTIFFILTAHFLFKHQQNTRDLNLHKTQKSRFCLFLRLFVVMGVGWMVEVISTVVGPPELWLVMDMVNASVGILVFIIYVGPRRARQGLWRKMCGRRPASRQPSENEDEGSCNRFCCRLCRWLPSSRIARATRDWASRMGGRSKNFSLTTTSGDGAGGFATSSSFFSSSSNGKRNTSATWVPSPPSLACFEGSTEGNVKNIRITPAENSMGGDI